MGTLQYSKTQVLELLKKRTARDMFNTCALRHWDNQTVSLKNGKSFILYRTNIDRITTILDKEGNIKAYNVVVSYPEKASYCVKADSVLHELKNNIQAKYNEAAEKINTLFEDMEKKQKALLESRNKEINEFQEYCYKIERLASARLLQIYSLDEFVVSRIIRGKESDKIEVLKVLDAKKLQEYHHAAVTNGDIACYIQLCMNNENQLAEIDTRLNTDMNKVYDSHDKKVAALTQWW